MDPLRVKQARLEAGLSLSQVAGNDVSRTFIHFVEQGKSRPSRAILSLIARRTRKPVSYFLMSGSKRPQLSADLPLELARAATQVKRLAVSDQLTNVERQAMKLLQVSLEQGVELTKSIRSATADRR